MSAKAPETVETGETVIIGESGDLSQVLAMIAVRMAALDEQATREGVPPSAVRYAGPAHVVHVYDVPAVLTSPRALVKLVRVVCDAPRTGVVVMLHGMRAELETMCARMSTALGAALQDGKVVQVIEPTTPVSTARHGGGEPPATAGGQVAAAVRDGDADSAVEILAGLISAATVDAMALGVLCEVLREAANALSPGGGIGCPLCLSRPLLRPDEVETHLLLRHGALAERAS